MPAGPGWPPRCSSRRPPRPAGWRPSRPSGPGWSGCPVIGPQPPPAARATVERTGAWYASHVYRPAFVHGVKTLAFELWEQLGGRSPGRVVVPAGNGTLVLGLYLGFRELADRGHIGHLPAIVAVQAERCAPLAGRRPAGPTAATGIAIAHPPRGRRGSSGHPGHPGGGGYRRRGATGTGPPRAGAPGHAGGTDGGRRLGRRSSRRSARSAHRGGPDGCRRLGIQAFRGPGWPRRGRRWRPPMAVARSRPPSGEAAGRGDRPANPSGPVSPPWPALRTG